MGNVILSLSSTTHSLDSLSNRGAEATSWVTRAFDFFVPPPPFWFFSHCLHCKTPYVYLKNVCTQFQIFFLCCLLFVSARWIRWTSGEPRGRNQRHGHWLTSEHICPPAVHMFTPDPSQVTVWVAPSLFPSRYLHPPPLSQRFSFLLSRKPTQRSYCIRQCWAPHLNHAHTTEQAQAEIPQTLKIGQIQRWLR